MSARCAAILASTTLSTFPPECDSNWFVVNASPALCALISGAITFLGDTRRKRIPTNVPIPT